MVGEEIGWPSGNKISEKGHLSVKQKDCSSAIWLLVCEKSTI
jgi:hypothetical protein